jgi:hypothetical protein
MVPQEGMKEYIDNKKVVPQIPAQIGQQTSWPMTFKGPSLGSEPSPARAVNLLVGEEAPEPVADAFERDGVADELASKASRRHCWDRHLYDEIGVLRQEKGLGEEHGGEQEEDHSVKSLVGFHVKFPSKYLRRQALYRCCSATLAFTSARFQE